ALALHVSGQEYVPGDTRSGDFPTTAGAYDTSLADGFDDAFVAKLNAAGSTLAYSTYLGGSFGDDGFGVAVGSSGVAYVTGVTSSVDFPTTSGAFDTSWNGRADAFVAKVNPAGSDLVC